MPSPVLVTAGQQPEPERAAPVDAPPPGSMLASLRARMAAQRKAKHLDVPIGGSFGTDLVARYGFLQPADMDRYSELQAGQVRASSLTVDLLISACRTIRYRHDGEWHDFETGFGGKLAEMLGEAADSPAPNVVWALFDNNPIALGTHADRVITWMQDPAEQPGESSAATT